MLIILLNVNIWDYRINILAHLNCLDKWFLLKLPFYSVDYSFGLNCFLYQIKKLLVYVLSVYALSIY